MLTEYGWFGGWSTTALAPGRYDIVAVGTNAAGDRGRSAPISITVDHTAPTAAMLIPSNNASLTGTALLDAAAGDNVGVSKVEFRLTGGSYNGAVVATGTPTIYGWLASLDTSAVPNGTYTLAARAYDTAGTPGTSAPITIKIDHNPPTAAMLIPSNNATVNGAALLDAAADDNVNVTTVEFRATGGALEQTRSSVPPCSRTSAGSAPGTRPRSQTGPTRCGHAPADAAGNAGNSPPITVTIQN